MNMSKFSIKCSDQMMKKIEDHCFTETQIEVGGFLVGYLEGETAHVTNVFPAKHSVGGPTQLTFTHDSWNAIYEQLEKEPEGTSLIGWFHSHPNFGVFLSDHDKFIQANFFKQDGQITVVVDPIRGRRGWFFSSAGKIEKYEEEKRLLHEVKQLEREIFNLTQVNRDLLRADFEDIRILNNLRKISTDIIHIAEVLNYKV